MGWSWQPVPVSASQPVLDADSGGRPGPPPASRCRPRRSVGKRPPALSTVRLRDRSRPSPRMACDQKLCGADPQPCCSACLARDKRSVQGKADEFGRTSESAVASDTRPPIMSSVLAILFYSCSTATFNYNGITECSHGGKSVVDHMARFGDFRWTANVWLCQTH